MGQVVCPSRFVPRPPVDQLWPGKDGAVAIALLGLLALPTYPPEPTRQFHYAEPPVWGPTSKDSPQVLLTGPLNYFPEPFRQFNVDLSTPWVGTPKASPPVLLWGPLPYAPPRFRQIDPPQDTPSFAAARAVWAPLLTPTTAPFIPPARQFNYYPDPTWSGTIRGVALSTLLPPTTALPFHNRPWTAVPPDFTPAQGPRSAPLVVTQLPAIPPSAVRGVHVASYDDPAVPWAMGGRYSVTLYIPQPLPGATLIQRTLTGVGI